MFERDGNFTLSPDRGLSGPREGLRQSGRGADRHASKGAGRLGRRRAQDGPAAILALRQDGGGASDLGAVTDLSHSRVRLALDAPDAWKQLMHAVAIDLDPAIFEVNAFAMTGIHHTPVLLWRTGENRYEIFALRTFAESVADWLAASAFSP